MRFRKSPENLSRAGRNEVRRPRPDLRKRRTALKCGMEQLEDRIVLASGNPANDVWLGVANNLWTNGANWSFGAPPTALQTAEFTAGGGRAIVEQPSQAANLITDSGWSGTIIVSNALTLGGLTLTGGQFNVNAASSVASLTISGGTLGGNADLDVTGPMVWTGGTVGGSDSSSTGNVNARGGLVIGGTTVGTSFVETLSGRTLNNYGVATIATALPNQGLFLASGGVLDNKPGASFSLVSDANLLNGGGAAASVVNEGTLAKTGGTGTSNINVPLTNTGTVLVQTGTLNVGTLTNYASSSSTLTGGTYNIQSTPAVVSNLKIGGDVVNNAAAIVLDGPNSQLLDASGGNALRTFTANQSAGRFTVQNGASFTSTLSLSNTGGLTVLPGSSFTTSGSVMNTGAVVLGGSLVAAGGFTQSSAGTLTEQIGGPPTPGPFGVVTSGSTAALGGTLDVVQVNGFTATAGQSFQILIFPQATGAFSPIHLPMNADPYQAAQHPFDLTLNVVSGAPIGPLTVNAGPDVTVDEVPGGEGAALSSTGSFSDPGATSWTATVDYGSGPVPLALNPDHTFALAHTYATDGPHTVTVTVNDGTSSQSDSMVFSVNDPAPILGLPASGFRVIQTAALGFSATAAESGVTPLQAPVSDLAFSLVGAPADASINPTTGVFQWTPAGDGGSGTSTFSVRVTDPDTGLYAEQPVSVVVLPAGILGNDLVVFGNPNSTVVVDATDPSHAVATIGGTTVFQGAIPLGGRIIVHEYHGVNSVTVFGNVAATLYGGDGSDTLSGGGGDDLLYGGGHDVLIGGPGHNTLVGATGGSDQATESADEDFQLGDGSLVATDASGAVTIQDSLVHITRVVATGGPGANAFNVSNWTGSATLDGGGGSDTYTINLAGHGAGTTTILDTGTTGLDRVTVNGLAAANAFGLAAGQVTLAHGAGSETVNESGIEALTIASQGAQTFAGPVVLGAATTITAGTSDVSFAGTVDGAFDLEVDTTGTTTFGGTVGGTTGLASLTTDAAGSTQLNGGSVATSGAQSYNDAAVLGAATSLTSTGGGNVSLAGPVSGGPGTDLNINAGTGDVTFSSTVDGAFTLTVNSSGTTAFDGAVGSIVPLVRVVTDTPGTTIIEASIRTTGDQTYNDAVALQADVTLTDRGPQSQGVIFNGTVDSDTPTPPRALVILADRVVVFNQPVGALHALKSLTTDVATAAQAPGTTQIKGGSVTTTGGQTYNHAVVLGADTTLTSTGGGDVAFARTVDGGFALTVDTAGVTRFGDVVGGSSPLASLTTDAPGSTVISAATVTTTGDQTYHDPLTLSPAGVTMSSHTAVTMDDPVSGRFLAGPGTNHLNVPTTGGGDIELDSGLPGSQTAFQFTGPGLTTSGPGGSSTGSGTGSSAQGPSASPNHVTLVDRGGFNTIDLSRAPGGVLLNLGETSGQAQTLFASVSNLEGHFTTAVIAALQQTTVSLSGPDAGHPGSFQAVVGSSNSFFVGAPSTATGTGSPQLGTSFQLTGSGNTVVADLGSEVTAFSAGNDVIQSSNSSSLQAASSFLASNAGSSAGVVPGSYNADPASFAPIFASFVLQGNSNNSGGLLVGGTPGSSAGFWTTAAVELPGAFVAGQASSGSPASLATKLTTISPTGLATKLTTISPTGLATKLSTISPTGLATKLTTTSPTGLITKLSMTSPTGLITKLSTTSPTGLIAKLSTTSPTGLITKLSTMSPTGLITKLSMTSPTGLITKLSTTSPTGLMTKLSTTSPTGLAIKLSTTSPTGLITKLSTTSPTGLITRLSTTSPTGLAIKLSTTSPTGLITKLSTTSPTGLITKLSTTSPTGLITKLSATSPTGLATKLSTISPTGLAAKLGMDPNMLAAMLSNPDTLAVMLSNPITLAAMLSDPATLGAMLSDPTTLSAMLSDPTTLGLMLSDPATLGAMLSDAATLRAMLSDPTTLGLMLSDPTTLGLMLSDPTTLELMLSDPTTLGLMLSDPTTLGLMLSDPATLGAMLSDPTTLGLMLSDPTTLGLMLSDPATLGAMLSDPATLGAMLSDPTILGAMLSDPTILGAMLSDPTILGEILSDPTTLEQYFEANPAALTALLTEDPQILQDFWKTLTTPGQQETDFITAALVNFFRLKVTLSGSGNQATGGVLSTFHIDNGLFIEQLTAAQVNFAATVADKNVPLSIYGLDVVLGGGSNVVDGGLLGNFTTGGGNTRFVIQDPSLLGLPSGTVLPTAITQSANYGGSFTGGGGNNTFYFVGGGSSNPFGSVAIGEAPAPGTLMGSDTLDFSSFQGGPVSLNLSSAATTPTYTQTVTQGILSLTLPTSNDVRRVVGSPATDTIVGNNLGDVLQDSAVQVDHPDEQAAIPPANVPIQWVWLDFNDPSSRLLILPGEVLSQFNVGGVIPPDIQQAILQGLQTLYDPFKVTIAGQLVDLVQFTTQQPTADQAPNGYITVKFNDTPTDANGNPQPIGLSDEIDFRNLNLSTVVRIDVNPVLGTDPVNQVPDTLADYLNLSVLVAAHEVGHTLGLEHSDAYGPIGFGISNPPGPAGYNPSHPGLVGAFTTGFDVMASPVSVGSTLQQAASGLTTLGERDAIALAFIAGGKTIDGTAGDPGRGGTPIAAHNSPAAAMPVSRTGGLYTLAVPNTLSAGFDAGKSFDVAAVDITGRIVPGAPRLDGDGNPVYETDILGNLILDGGGQPIPVVPSSPDDYSFQGKAGDVMNFQLMSSELTRFGEAGASFDTVLTVYRVVISPSGISYVPIATDDDIFESSDSSVTDVTLPADGTYVVEVGAFNAGANPDQKTDPSFYQTLIDPGTAANPNPNYNPAGYYGTATGKYELFMYRFAAYNASGGNDTLVGGSGNDTFVGNQGNDTFVGNQGSNLMFGGGGVDTVQETGAGSFTLSSTQLVDPNGTDALNNIQAAVLTDSSTGAGNSFTILENWTGDATLSGGVGSDRLVAPDTLSGRTTTVLTDLAQVSIGQDLPGTLSVQNVGEAGVGGSIAGQFVASGNVTTLAVGTTVTGLIGVTGKVTTLAVGQSVSSTGVVSAGDLAAMTVGPDALAPGDDMAGQVVVLPTGTLGDLRVAGGTPGTIIAGHVGTVRAYGGYGPVVMQVKENRIQRRVEAAVPESPSPPPAPSPAGVTFQYVYESGALANPQLTARVTNAAGPAPDQYDLSLVTYNDAAKFNLARLDAAGVSGIRSVAVEGDLLAAVTQSPTVSGFFKLPGGQVDATPAGVRLPSDALAGVSLRDYAPNGGIQARSIQAVAFGSHTRTDGRIETGAVAGAGDAARLLASGTAIVPINDTIRVPFADLPSQQVGLFLATDKNGGYFDGRDVVLVVQSVSTANSTGTRNDVRQSNAARGAVIALVKAVPTIDSKGNPGDSAIQSIDLRGDGGSIRTNQLVTTSITSAGSLGDLALGGPLAANVTAPSVFGSFSSAGAYSGTFQTTGLRTDPISGVVTAVAADLGRVYVDTSGNSPVVTATTFSVASLGGRLISRGDLIDAITTSGGLDGIVAAQGNLGKTFTDPTGQVVRVGGILASGTITGQVLVLGSLIGDFRANGGLKGGRVAAGGGILGNMLINGGLDSGAAIVSGDKIGDPKLGTSLTVSGSNKGIIAAKGAIAFGKGAPGGNVFSNAGAVSNGPNAAAIDAIFASSSFDVSPLDLANFNRMLKNLNGLVVSGGVLKIVVTP